MDPVRSNFPEANAGSQSANRTSNGMNGIFLVDKPQSWTSHDVVAKVRSMLRRVQSNEFRVSTKTKNLTPDSLLMTRSSKIRVGHTGTLDPAASGLLILVIGSYTKRAAEFSKLDKTYEAEITLGATSSTGDTEGEISRQKTVDGRPGKAEIEEVLKELTGKIQQKPHPYSAVKVGGQRAYKLSRKGQAVDLEPREVTVYSLQSTVYRYPKLCITARVSSGTYIRSLAEDIGQKLGTGAYLSSLRRTKVGKFDLKNAINLQDIEESAIIK